MITRAAIARAPGAPLEIVDVELDPPRAGEALVEIVASGVCDLDEFTRSGADPDGVFPAILGHAGAGVVRAVGPGVFALKPGDHVLPLRAPDCRDCEFCLHPKTSLCQTLRDPRRRGLMPDGSARFRTLDGATVHHFLGCSTFAQFTVLPEYALAKIRADAPLDKVCAIGCAAGAGLEASFDPRAIKPGARCAIFGLGGVAQDLAAALRAAGASAVVGVDADPDRRAAAGAFALDAVLPRGSDSADLAARLRAALDGPAACSFETTGETAHLRRALDAAHRGWGETLMIGAKAFGPDGRLRARLWRGGALLGVHGAADLPKIVDWWMEGRIALAPIPTASLPLDRINEGFALVNRGESVRPVVVY